MCVCVHVRAVSEAACACMVSVSGCVCLCVHVRVVSEAARARMVAAVVQQNIRAAVSDAVLKSLSP